MSTGSCSSWGGSNYVTFDGTSYSFRDNCTHVVMREIRPRHGNLTVLLNNYFCGATTASARCPRALSVHYESMEIVLTTITNADGQEESLVSVGAGGAWASTQGGCLHAFPLPGGQRQRGLREGAGHTATQGHRHNGGGRPWGEGCPQPRASRELNHRRLGPRA